MSAAEQAADDVEEHSPLLPRDQPVEDEEESWGGPPDASPSRRLTFLERLLLAALLLLLCLSAIFIGLFAGERASHKDVPTVTQPGTTVTHTETERPQPTKPPNNEQTCLTTECVSAAASLFDGIDTAVDPCENFFSFANGRWLAENPIPQDKAQFGITQQIDDDNKRVAQKYLNGAITSSEVPKEDRDNLNHLQAVYHACMDEQHLHQVASKPLMDIVDEIKRLWRRPGPDSRGIFDPPPVPLPPIFSHLPQPSQPRIPEHTRPLRLTKVLSFLHARAIHVFFEPYVDADWRNDPEKLLLNLHQADLGMPDPSYYEDGRALKVYENVVAKTLNEVYAHATTSYEDQLRMAQTVVQLEKKLAKALASPLELDDPYKTYNPFSIDQLQKLLNNVFHIRDYFASFSPRPAVPDPTIVTWPSYFEKMATIIEQTEDSVLESYFVWRTGLSLAPMLSTNEPIWKEYNILKSFLSGTDPDAKSSRQDVCTRSSLSSMGLLVGHFFLKDAFSTATKMQASELVEGVVQAFTERLKRVDWLDEPTRQRAIKKAKALRIKIGFPRSPDVLNPAAMERYYAQQAPFDPHDFFGNSMRAKVLDQKRMWNRIGAAVNHGEWEMIPTEANAYYSPSSNELAIPAGQIHWPFFAQGTPEYIQFGALGALSGHEITHAFDKTGRLYNDKGRLEDWWTNATTAAFEKKSQCIIDQYAQYSVKDPKGEELHINSRFTAGEDVADAGGLAAALAAWISRMNSDPSGDQYVNSMLPGSHYTRAQLFYIAYARTWATAVRPEEAARRIHVDPHSPAHFRVLGPLSNDRGFQEAFQCQIGTRYNPDREKCQVW